MQTNIPADFSLDKFEKWLNTFLNFEKRPEKNIFWLDTIRFLAEQFGNPEQSYKIIHVAGSKGKGSVSTYCANILSEHGYKTGLYTSPHINSFFERISLCGKLFSRQTYLRAAKEMYSKRELFEPENLPKERKATWFEIATLYAFLVFRQEKCDYVVLETGLGGRLDATNICTPLASIITPIELEHTEYLGDTIEKISYEKAGIIKPSTKVFISHQKIEAKKVFEKECKKNNSPVYFADDFVLKSDYYIKNSTPYFDMKIKTASERKNSPVQNSTIEIKTPVKMYGKIQAENSALAILAVSSLLESFSIEKCMDAIKKTKIPARFEIKEHESQKIVLDGAHTVNSITSTLKTYTDLFSTSRTILFACAKDKDVENIAETIIEYGFNEIYITKPGKTKACDIGKMEDAFFKAKDNAANSSEINICMIENTKQAFHQALNTAKRKNESLLVTGSFYLIAEIIND